MDRTASAKPTVVVTIADPDLLDQVLSVTAVVGVEPLVLSEPGQLRHWASASMLLLGVDQARSHRSGRDCRIAPRSIWLGKTSAAHAWRWSIRLGPW